MNALPSSTRWVALSAMVAALCLPAHAGDEPEEPLETDRPDITETSKVVGRRRFQIETSVQREHQDSRRRETRTLLTPTLFRMGLDDRWEARLETDGYTRERTSVRGAGTSRTSGYSPISVGTKYHFQDPREGSCRPSLGALAHLTFPSGSSDFATERLTGEAKLLADWELTDRWSLGSNLGLLLGEDESDETFVGSVFTVAPSYKFNDRLRGYVEGVFLAPEASNGRTGIIFDTGAAYLINPDTQLDFAVGWGISGREQPDFFWTVGFSRRF